MTVVAERLQKAMEMRGWDQDELARRVTSTQGSISRILVGRTRNSRLMPRIAVQLGVSLPWLLGEEDEEAAEDVTVPYSTEELEWLELLRSLEVHDRQAVVRLTRSLATSARSPSVHV